jgi:hypothetical protein
LVIVGVSDESEKLLDDYVAKKGARFAIVRSTGAMAKYRGEYYPSFFTIGADGKILSVPDERIPSEALLAEALKSVPPLADLPDDPRFDGLRRDWHERKFKRVADHLDKLLAQDGIDQELRAVLQKQRDNLTARIERQLAEIPKLGEGPDWLAAQRRLGEIRDDYAGLPPAVAADELLDKLKDDKKVQAEIRTQKRLEAILERYDPSKQTQRKKLLAELQAFRKRYAGTYAADLASIKCAELAR